jgi:hypothetical protein
MNRHKRDKISSVQFGKDRTTGKYLKNNLGDCGTVERLAGFLLRSTCWPDTRCDMLRPSVYESREDGVLVPTSRPWK